jgi:vancomycin resistance protein YoaR
MARNLGWFMVPPITVLVLISMGLVILLASYQSQHQDRIYTGVYLWGVDLSGANQVEAQAALSGLYGYFDDPAITLIDPRTGQEWTRSPAEMGIYFDTAQTFANAYNIGRDGLPFSRLRTQMEVWYHGRAVAPIIVFDEGRLDQAIVDLAAEINQSARDASLHYDGQTVDFRGGQTGRMLDVADLRERLLMPMSELRPARIELLIHESRPRITDTSQAAREIQQIISSPVSFYLQEPLADVDLDRVTITTDELIRWLRIQMVDERDGQAHYDVFIDDNALRQWLTQYEDALYREPKNARFYFDDDTRELVLVERHVNGRALDVEATAARFHDQVITPNRSLPFMLKDIVPVAHSEATAEDLGITELVSQSTTWFYGSSAARKHNIARSASNFYGIVIAPGEEFSFNHYLGSISEEEGYETGLIIWGGRTIEGVGGGVCQVSTTVFQAAFWAGFPVTERWPHGYQVVYYDDGEGAGMDAAIFSPLIDLRFINNTPHYLLIENYFSEAFQSLTFKFYSTSMGRTITKEGPVVANVIPPKPDLWEFNADLAEGEIDQVDWAVEGSDVTVRRIVRNAAGDVLIDENFFSRYIPWQNIYQYGPGVTPPSQRPAEPTPPADGEASDEEQ